ncbi:MAG: hypothetical protein U1F83_01630 [Verrucomicrobiota bacterium]
MNYPHLPQSKNGALLRLTLCLATLCLASGCKLTQITDPITGPGYTPKNVYVSLRQLPVHVRRVAVLPATCLGDHSEVDAGLELLEPVITDELGRTRKFELVRVPPEKLRALTGHATWSAEETLPTGLLKQLRDELECDAVLFTRLTQFRAYPPMAVGLSLKLLEVDKAEYIWAVDEVFDANEPGVANDARRFQRAREQLPWSLADSRSILISPSGFGRYAANSVFRTLPVR